MAVGLLLLGCGGGEDASGRLADREREAARPGGTVEVTLLGEGVVSTPAPEFGASFAPDGRTLYFNRATEDRSELRILVSVRTDAGWSEPRSADFARSDRDLDAFVTPDGGRVYFNSPGSSSDAETSGFDIWYADRTGSAWSEPVRAASPLNSDSLEVFTSATRGDVLYFTSTRDGPLGVYRAHPVEGGWGRPERLEFPSLASPGNPLIAPDGRLLVLTGRGPDGSTDLFVSCRREAGWAEPRRLPPPINSAYMDFAPGLDPIDGSLLFTSERPGLRGPVPDTVRPPGDIYRSSLRPSDLCEGRRAATATGEPAAAPATGSPPTRRVALTFDDLPGTGLAGPSCSEDTALAINRRLLRQLSELEAAATGFVNEGLGCRDGGALEDVLRLWLDAGHSLGNHTFSHVDIDHVPLDLYLADLERGERLTRRLLAERGRDLRYFRPPLLHTGGDSVKWGGLRRYLDDRDQVLAPVTIDNQEWIFDAVYRRAVAKGDTALAQRTSEAYVPYLEEVVAHFEAWSSDVVGYEPPQVLLLHVNRINADHFRNVARMLRDRGYEFVSLEDALADSAYQLPDGYVGPRGLSWVHRWALARGMEIEEEPREPAWLSRRFRARE